MQSSRTIRPLSKSSNIVQGAFSLGHVNCLTSQASQASEKTNIILTKLTAWRATVDHHSLVGTWTSRRSTDAQPEFPTTRWNPWKTIRDVQCPKSQKLKQFTASPFFSRTRLTPKKRAVLRANQFLWSSTGQSLWLTTVQLASSVGHLCMRVCVCVGGNWTVTKFHQNHFQAISEKIWLFARGGGGNWTALKMKVAQLKWPKNHPGKFLWQFSHLPPLELNQKWPHTYTQTNGDYNKHSSCWQSRTARLKIKACQTGLFIATCWFKVLS